MAAVKDRDETKQKDTGRSVGVPLTEARTEGGKPLEGRGAAPGAVDIDMDGVPLEEDPDALRELQKQTPELPQGRPILRMDSYQNKVVDYV